MTSSIVTTFRVQRWLRRSVFAGFVIYLLGFLRRSSFAFETDLIDRILLFGLLVIVPLGLMVAIRDERERSTFIFRVLTLVQPFAAAAVAVSFLVEQGIAAALLALPWFIVTGLLVIHGLTRLLDPRLRTPEELSVSAALIFIAIGGFWLIVSRLGIQPVGFGETIILLTAVHFHYAGFAAPILAGLAGRALTQRQQPKGLFTLVVGGLIGGTPLVAAGISFSPPLALVGTLIISSALLLLSVLVILRVVPGLPRRYPQVLLIISSVAPFVSMVLATLYAYSLVMKKLIIDIPQMAMSHGIINAFGFAFFGLVAWWLLLPDE